MGQSRVRSSDGTAERVLFSAVSVVETRMAVFGGRGPRGVVLLDQLFRLLMIEAAAVDASRPRSARKAGSLSRRPAPSP